ncbi:MAG: TauD/TfdA family dioxygenase [Pseudophaeobacter sp.]|uniref:TauD/TfdA family dioxygenase n=1 Tax=Pseudophaeobacter sp. TaxID=1971739 RepID=UPI003298FE69
MTVIKKSAFDNQLIRVFSPKATRRDYLSNSPFAVVVYDYVQEKLVEDDFVVIDVSKACNTLQDFREVATSITSSLGRLMVQNEAGDTVVEVYDRQTGRIEDGARYHQTRQGGDIHTDSVNRPEPMLYLGLACAAPAVMGGESIIIRGREVYSVLQEQPEVIDCLSQEFFFEGRGMNSENSLFKIPILELKNGKASFRYLRSYIASAHDRAGEPLSEAQIRAFDILDCILEMSSYQHRFTLQPGQILFANDTATFHGRTSFIDGPVPGSFSDRRHMLRFWVD